MLLILRRAWRNGLGGGRNVSLREIVIAWGSLTGRGFEPQCSWDIFFIFNLFVEKNLIFIKADPFIHKLQIDFKRKKIAATANISVEFAGISL